MTRYRPAAAGDAPAVARLHAESWQRHYRGAFSDGFLDVGAPGHLRALWARRLATGDPLARTYLAQADDDPGEILGFVHVRLGDDDLRYAWPDPSVLLSSVAPRPASPMIGSHGQVLRHPPR